MFGSLEENANEQNVTATDIFGIKNDMLDDT